VKSLNKYFWVTLVVSILVGIIFPFAMTGKPIDWDKFFLIMALSFSLPWAIYSIILLGNIFLFVKRNRKELKTLTKGDPSFLHSMQEWDALWKITVGRYKDPGIGNPNWN
jgi:hypothetical protein